MTGRADAALVLALALLALAAMLSVAASQILLGVLLVAVLWRWRRGTAPHPTGLEWPALALVIWALAMIPLSDDRAQSLLYARRWYLLVPIWVGATLAAWRGARLAALGGLAAGAVGSALYGMVRFRGAAAAYVDQGEQVGVRALPMSGYMTGGGLLMLAGLVMLAGVLVVRSRRHRAWLVAGLAVVGACLVLTLTRSAWLGFAAGSVGMVALARPRWLPAAAAALVLAGVLMPGAMRDRLVSAFDPADPGNAQRVLMWRTGWQWVRENPVVGLGDRDLKNAYRAHHAGRPDVEVQGHLHSNLVMFAVAWGVPGFLLAVGLLLATACRLWRTWRLLGGWRRRGRPADPEATDLSHDLARTWCLGACGAWIGLNVAGLFEWNFGDAEVALLFWLIVGMGLGAARNDLAPTAHV